MALIAVIEGAEYPFSCRQGDIFSVPLVWKDNLGIPVDLTGYDAEMEVSSGLSCGLALVELTVGNGGIVLGGVLGTIDLLLTPAQTDALEPGLYTYGLKMSIGAYAKTILYGSFEVLPRLVV